MIRGIGLIDAARLVTVFRAAVFEVIEQAPERLREVPGIGAVRIFRTCGNDAVQVMAENPYRLAHDIRGIGLPNAELL
jgi:exodeoxyribonuclease V alpha subunit